MKKCNRCGRKLTAPESIARGYGPVCWTKVQKGQQVESEHEQLTMEVEDADD